MSNLRKLPVAVALEVVAIYVGLEQLGIEVPSLALPTGLFGVSESPPSNNQSGPSTKHPHIMVAHNARMSRALS